MSKITLSNSYKTVFVLNKSKLVRLNDVMDKHFQKITSGNLSVKHLVKFNNGKEANFTNIDELFDLDNGIKNRITELKTTYEKNTSLALVHFDGDRRIPQISIHVEGEETDWTNESFAEIEEQTERTKENSWIYELKKSNPTILLQLIFIVLMLPIMLGAFKDLFSTTILESKISKKEKVRQELISKIDSAITIDQKLDVLLETTKLYTLDGYKKEEIIEENKKSTNPFVIFANWKFYLVAIPVLLLIGILIYLIRYCYWMYAFVWGDMEEDYKKMVDRRKTLWNILIGSLILGILSNLFVFGLTEMI